MKIRRDHTRAFCLLLTACFASTAMAGEKHAPDAIVGLWETADAQAHVEVYEKKGHNGQVSYEGKIVWLKDPNFDGPGPEHGKPLRDAYNPDKARRHDPVLGLTILKGFQYNARKRRWQGGTVYDPEEGKTYKGVINLRDDAKPGQAPRLAIRGFIGLRIFGSTTLWKRAHAGAVEADTRGAEE